MNLWEAEELVQCRASPSLTLTVTMCLRYVLALTIYCKCIRVGNSRDALHAWDVVAELFYLNNMVMYMDPHCSDLLTCIKAPPEIHMFLEHKHSF